MQNPNQMQIVMKLMVAERGNFWYFNVVQRGEVIKSFLSAEEAVRYIETMA